MANRIANEKVSPVAQAFLIVAGTAIEAGHPLVIKPSDGYVCAITEDGYVCGVSAEEKAVGEMVKVQTGCWEFPAAAGVTAADVGQIAYFADDSTVNTVSSAGQRGGIITAVERAGYAYVTFQYPIAQ